jgi:multicomponent Na+:H+ antiporter subunit D
VYALTGHLNYGALREASLAIEPLRLLPAIVVLSVGFLLKAGGFPLFAWLPATYHALPAPVLAVFAAIGTKVGVYAILRMHAGIFPGGADLSEAWGWLAVATMVIGVLGAAWHWDIRRILAFHSISQVGYMLLGIALNTVEGAQAALVYAVHHSFVKGNLFLLAAIVWRVAGSYDLRRIGGLQQARPWVAALFLTQALSLVGIPPSSGFWAKLLIVRESLAGGHVAWTVAALLVGALTMYSMLKIWMEAFWKPHPDERWTPGADARLWPAIAVTAALAALTTAIGLWPEPLLRATDAAARLLFVGSTPR